MSRVCSSCGATFADDAVFCGQDGALTLEKQDPNEPDRRIGTQLGEHIVVGRVADGAMGRVYEGRHIETRDRVAIKVLHDEVAQDDVSVERFRREYETAQSLDNPYIVKVLHFGQTEDGSHFMTMEFLDGEELADVLSRESTQPPARTIRLMCQIALGLQHAHSCGVVHRDLKPDNIFVCSTNAGDVVRILDFGSVKLQMASGPKLTALGTTLGSPYYMSPEQAMGKLDVDQRTDVFAAAAIMHEMATGKVAFEGANVAEILMKIVQFNPAPASATNPAYPPSYDDVIAKGLAKDKNARFGTAVELAQAMLRAFSLEADVSRWASGLQADLDARLSDRAPAPAAPYDAPPAIAPDDLAASSRSSIPELPIHRSMRPAMVALGLAAVVAVVVGAYLLFAA